MLAAALLAVGCGGHAYMRPASTPSNDIHQWIEQNYDKFEASYSGSAEKPGAIRFDLKGDGIELTGEGWRPIVSEAELNELVDRMVRTYLHKYKGTVGALGPQLYKIISPEGKLIGYFFSPIPNTLVARKGNDYRMAPVTELDVRNEAYPWYRMGPPRKGRGVSF